jgi:serine/threonine protein kinase
MNDENWEHVTQLFNRVLSEATESQNAFLATACADDELRCEVESLLAAYRKADEFIETPAVTDILKLVDSNRYELSAGKRIGQYEVVRKLGDGGMGAVYLAARVDAQFEKQVAIKLIKFGFDNEFIVNRFLSERQILANLDHPNIARLIDGGTTDAGSPYLVMEYIEGRQIDKYCDDERLSVRKRLDLFRKVCAAVQYAHTNLVVHRDIKPNNILVMTDGTPKLLDFGIAKLLIPEFNTQKTGQTATAIRQSTGGQGRTRTHCRHQLQLSGKIRPGDQILGGLRRHAARTQ